MEVFNAKPNKAGGQDKCHLHIFSLAPAHSLEILFDACNYFLYKPLPAKWSDPDIFLLSEKGEVFNPTN